MSASTSTTSSASVLADLSIHPLSQFSTVCVMTPKVRNEAAWYGHKGKCLMELGDPKCQLTSAPG